ncbi:MAG: hypothetical protein ABSH24_33085 [Bryobacteraceae bacterium]
MGAFLLAHLPYICLFTRNWTAGIRPDPPRLATVLLIPVYSVALSL